ncbi:hypothetical protein [Limnofasciculus baicalensis]|uniref:Uncharacterized protein n=1 Tax=Limnofasciculus baicalensis BBK-W-15 TaxID=2699891 RepID=A0AAE3GSW0_9CYAN|nr:hypothetical protein [Limnofasciculus baicalensis]MCP2729934.1 hypothetical protein [Limnofasciculus baicalensis BBK-W-15]
MTSQLTPTEIQEIQQILKDYNPSQPALTILTKNQGRLDASFDELWEDKNGTQMFNQGKSLWKVMLGEIRKEICGDDGFRGKVKEYTNNPASAPLLTGLIVSVSSIAIAHGLPIDPAIATIIVLYVVKIGLNTFCEYNQPETNPQLPAAAEEKRK